MLLQCDAKVQPRSLYFCSIQLHPRRKQSSVLLLQAKQREVESKQRQVDKLSKQVEKLQFQLEAANAQAEASVSDKQRFKQLQVTHCSTVALITVIETAYACASHKQLHPSSCASLASLC